MLEKKAIAGWMRLLEATAQSRCDKWYIGGLLLFELLLCSVILVKVPYTEIDWIAYMEEVEGFENGERDYAQIRGGTGPLVYPAGFLYLFSILKRITHANIRSAQFIFLIFYLIHQWFVLLIYQQVVNGIRKQQQNQGKSKTDPTSSTTHTSAVAIWSWRVAMATTCLSKRIHSIFILRLFNDGPTMLLTYLSIWLFTRQRWNIGCFIFSLAVSIKMNVLLFAPGLLLLLLQANDNLLQVIQTLFFACALPQLVLGAPFLLTYPQSYIRKAFELDRVFFYKWTVNWKFLDEDFFLSKNLAISLLFLHLAFLAYFCMRWLHAVKSVGNRRLYLKRSLSPNYIISTLLTSNFIGIVVARTLHYQFYAWYFHALPFILWNSDTYPVVIRILLLIAVESSFLTYPATPISSAILQAAHLAILLQVKPSEPISDVKAKSPKRKGE